MSSWYQNRLTLASNQCEGGGQLEKYPKNMVNTSSDFHANQHN
jgi:hypothetical protein